MLDCTNKCRACNTCYFLDPKHVCPNRSAMLAFFRNEGVHKQYLRLPDKGMGQPEWKKAGFKWKDPARTWYGVRDTEVDEQLEQKKADPLKHPCVVVPES